MESTNKLIHDANQDLTTILRKKTATVVTNLTFTNYSGTFKYIDTNYTTDLSLVSNYNWDIYVKDNQTNITYAAPLQSDFGFASWAKPLALITYIDDDNGFQRINLQISKYNGAITNSYTVYYVVYSTKISDDIVL